MPINTLQNWLAEFNMWLPDKMPETPPDEPPPAICIREFGLHVLNDSHKTMNARSKVYFHFFILIEIIIHEQNRNCIFSIPTCKVVLFIQILYI